VNSDPHLWIKAIRSSHDRLKKTAEPLVPDAVETPSMASEWTVAQVLSHLGSQAEIFDAILSAAIEGSDLPGPEAFPPVWDVWNARSPLEQVTESLKANEDYVRRAEGLSETQLSELRFALFGMDLDMAGFLQMRLGELALHTWDVTAALDPGATVSADAVDLLIDGVPDMARRIGKPSDKPWRIRVITSAPARDLALSVGEAVDIEPWSEGPSDGVLRLPAEALVRLIYGRLDDAHAPKIDFEAEGLTLDSLREVFPGV
jgi:uncharacterized protein (TIGR03083 family)